MEILGRKILKRIPNSIFAVLISFGLVPFGLFLYLLNSVNPVSNSIRRVAFKGYSQKFPDRFHGFWLYLQFLWQTKDLAAVESLLEDIKTKFEPRPELYKFEVKKRMKLEGVSKHEALKSVFFSTPFEKYLDLVENSSDLQQPLKYDSIIIVTHGRTGSTLLQGILNSINGVEISGENYNALYHLFNFYRALKRTGKNHEWAVLPKHPFFHKEKNIKEQSILANCREMVLDFFDVKKKSKVFGFKEIRYFNIIKDTPPYLNFLQGILPNPLFVFLERDMEEVLQSAWWKDHHPDEIKSKFRQLYQSFNQFKVKNSKNSFTISYSDITQKSDCLVQLFDKIGAPYDPNLVDFILSVPHSYAPKEKNKVHHFKDFPI